MWNIGFGELAVICIVLIIAVGPERLPSMMKTVGKTVRTLRQASRDLRESTGIDELLREDFDYRPPVRKPEPPVGPSVAREVEPEVIATNSPVTSPEATPNVEVAASSLPSDGPLTASPAEVGPLTAATPVASASATPASIAASIAQAEPTEHANVGTTLPSDAPLASNRLQPPRDHEPAPPPEHEPAPLPAPDPIIEAKPREG